MVDLQAKGRSRARAAKARSLALAVLLAAGGLVRAGGAKPSYPADTTTIEPGHQLENGPGWYRDAVIYQIWVKAFADGIYQDGIGDLPGILGKLDYLQSLGVNTLWLSPVFECSYKGANMHGYDTTDYYAINDRFGTRADLARLIDATHARGMRILFDFVPNHTSTAHPWFDDEKTRKTFYIWRDKRPSGWGLPWGGGDSEDVWKEFEGSYYYTAFAGMADLDFYNPAVVKEIQNVERFWLDRGFDGMRVDAVRYLCESGPRKAADQPDTHARLREFRSIIDEYASGDAHPHPAGDPARHSVKMMVAEAWTRDEAGVAPYYGNGSDEFNLCLDFALPPRIFTAISTHAATEITGLWESELALYPKGCRTATFDSNHDNVISRPGSQYAGDRARIILAEAMNLLSPGTPIIYYGNEVGMTGAAGTDLNLRQPMDWAAVTAQSSQPDSILSWCKYLIQARSAYPALRGDYATLATSPGPDHALAYLRSAGAGRVVVVANLTAQPLTVSLKGLAKQGIKAGTQVSPILGKAGAWNGDRFEAAGIPPYGVRVYHAGGDAYQGVIHGDIQ